jgi:FemAB family
MEMEEIRVAGSSVFVPSAEIEGQTVVVTGKRIRKGQVKDEDLAEGITVRHPESFIQRLKGSGLKVDFFTFAQRSPQTTPQYDYHLEWQNWALTPTTSYQEWWKKLPQETRKNVRRAAKRGVSVKQTPFNDALVNAVYKIYNETPMRGGRPFWHFGKSMETVRKGLSTYLDRSDFLGAYWKEELIGFIKLVYVDDAAMLIHIICMNAHHDKRPMNALIAKAVEVCERKGIKRLIYGQFVYGNNYQSSFLEFKRRNGFEQFNFPRYYVPLTLRGKLFVQLRLYKGVTGLVPEAILTPLLNFRTRYYNAKLLGREKADQIRAGRAHQFSSIESSRSSPSH